MSKVESEQISSGKRFQDAVDRLQELLQQRCDASHKLVESLMEQGSPRAEKAGQEFLNHAEELHVFNKLLELVTRLTNDLNEMIEKEKTSLTESDKIEVVEVPGASKRMSGKGDKN